MLGSVGSQLGVLQLGSVPVLEAPPPPPVPRPDVLELVGTFSGALALAGSESRAVEAAGSSSSVIHVIGTRG
jgi:hypothetical protein